MAHDQEDTVKEEEFESDDPDQAKHVSDIETEAIHEGQAPQSGATTKLKKMVVREGKPQKKYRPLTEEEVRDFAMKEAEQDEEYLEKPISRSWKVPPSRKKDVFQEKGAAGV